MPHKVCELAISHLRHYKSDFYTVKSKVGLLDEYISTSYKVCLRLVPHKVRELAKMGLGRCFKVTLQTRAPENFRVRRWGAERRVSRAQTRERGPPSAYAEII